MAETMLGHGHGLVLVDERASMLRSWLVQDGGAYPVTGRSGWGRRAWHDARPGAAVR